MFQVAIQSALQTALGLLVEIITNKKTSVEKNRYDQSAGFFRAAALQRSSYTTVDETLVNFFGLLKVTYG